MTWRFQSTSYERLFPNPKGLVAPNCRATRARLPSSFCGRHLLFDTRGSKKSYFFAT
jgi:hypothetical protein